MVCLVKERSVLQGKIGSFGKRLSMFLMSRFSACFFGGFSQNDPKDKGFCEAPKGSISL